MENLLLIRPVNPPLQLFHHNPVCAVSIKLLCLKIIIDFGASLLSPIICIQNKKKLLRNRYSILKLYIKSLKTTNNSCTNLFCLVEFHGPNLSLPDKNLGMKRRHSHWATTTRYSNATYSKMAPNKLFFCLQPISLHTFNGDKNIKQYRRLTE